MTQTTATQFFSRMKLAAMRADRAFGYVTDGQSPAAYRDALITMQDELNKALSEVITWVGGDGDAIASDGHVPDIKYAFEDAIEAWENTGETILDAQREWGTWNREQTGVRG